MSSLLMHSYPPTDPHNICGVASTGWPLTTKKGAMTNYKPKLLFTDNLAFKESSTYPFFSVSDCDLPCLLNNLSGTPLLAAAVAHLNGGYVSNNAVMGIPICPT